MVTDKIIGNLRRGRRWLHLDLPGHGLLAVIGDHGGRIKHESRGRHEIGQLTHGNGPVQSGGAHRGHGHADHLAGGIEHRPARIPRVELVVKLNRLQPPAVFPQRGDPAAEHGDVGILRSGRPSPIGQTDIQT